MTHAVSLRPLVSLVSLLALGGLALLGGACYDAGTPDGPVGSADSALTAAQCNTFDVHGKVQICHKTSSVAHPYTILRLSEQGCIQGHVAHGGDYVTSTDPASPLYDPTCNGGGCLPVNAPCDATLPCCDGSSCTNGVCVAAPVDLCTEPCPLPGFADAECTEVPCDPGTGVCGEPDYYAHLHELCNGNTGACSGGVCHDLPPDCESVACANGGQCVDNFCACPAGFAGTHCEIDISGVDECADGPCVNGGTCIDGLGSYTCSCSGGFTGTWCEIPPAAATCPCSGDPTWEENLTGVPTQFYQDATYATGAYVIDTIYRTTDVYKDTGVCSAKKYDGNTLVASVEHGSLSADEVDACYGIVSAWISSVP